MLATSIHLEGIAIIVVDGGTTPYLSISTKSATVNRQGRCHNVVTLGFLEHTGATITANRVWIISSSLGKDDIALHQILIDIDDNITIYVTTIEATAIDTTLYQTAIDVCTVAGISWISCRSCTSTDEVVFTNIPFYRVPLQFRTDSL